MSAADLLSETIAVLQDSKCNKSYQAFKNDHKKVNAIESLYV